MTSPPISLTPLNPQAQPYYSDFAVVDGIIDTIASIHRAGYVYDLGRGFYNWATVPPPRGTAMNCRAVAHLTKRLVEERMNLPATRLRVVGARGVGPNQQGFFIPVEATKSYALGSAGPLAYDAEVQGWEFGEHWRLEDTQTGKLFDPTFGTSGELNPIAIAARWEYTTALSPVRITNYGDKYLIIRRTTDFRGERIDLTPNLPFLPQYGVENADYILT